MFLLQCTMMGDHTLVKRALDEERFRCDRLEEQINDLTELHQHEVTNIKQVRKILLWGQVNSINVVYFLLMSVDAAFLVCRLNVKLGTWGDS